MKATYNGITMEGTPKEIAELKQLLDDQWKKRINTKPPYNPNPYQSPYQPFYPGTWIGTATYTVPNTSTVTSWNNSNDVWTTNTIAGI